jgi:hypothetical protein
MNGSLGSFGVSTAAERLAANAVVFAALVDGVGAEQARWKPEPQKWSILEVTCHIADEEVEDFRRRLDLTLHHPGDPWPPIDPQAWATERRYNERELAAALERFLSERRESVEWLRGLAGVDLDLSYEHPRAGRLRAGDLLASWLDHDLIHIRQITRLHHQWLVERALPYRTEYAGGF